MSTNQRLEVWRGTRAKTSGGLTKNDLVKNKRGKIVSKKKSSQAGSQNNLGHWLREKGKKVPASQMLHKKGGKKPPLAPPKKAPAAKKAPAKKSPAPVKKPAPKAVPKKKPVPKAKPKPKVAAPKKPVASAPKKKTKFVRKEGKTFAKGKINPLTKQAYDKTSSSGYVENARISLDNVKRTRLRRKKFVTQGAF